MLRTEAGTLTFAAVRKGLALPELANSAAFPADVQAEAEHMAAQHAFGGREDATGLPLVTIDPPGAMDLDQALMVQRAAKGGFTMHCAISDIGAFVRPGGALDAEAQRRGLTLYLPDAKVPLHPTVLSEGAASLLPGQTRPAVLWTINLDADGEPTGLRVRRALVRSIARLDYDGVSASIAAGRLHPSISALPELGRLRRRNAHARGAVELVYPEQEVEPDGAGGWRIVLRRRNDVDLWNAEISLLTGMCAAQMMLEARVGLLRTLPDPPPETIEGLRRAAVALGVEWRDDQTPACVLLGLDPRQPRALAMYTEGTRLLRGKGYVGFDGATPAQTRYTGVGAPYAHVTAPIRRLVDRYGTEVCLAVDAGTPVPQWTRQALPLLPEVMAASERLGVQAERACLDQVESWLLAGRVGEVFDAIVLRSADGESNGAHAESTADVFVTDPPVLGRCFGDGLQDGSKVKVRLLEADPATRRVRFEAVGEFG